MFKIINPAMNYGGKADIIQAIKKYIQEGKDVNDLNETIFESIYRPRQI
ncbi:undecaprenyl diphosphate synthase family protein [Paenibacillus sp. FSL H7-0331]|nr:undecaprenyl diphosphate synthase family protein [Paenibacillus sp. FSL H7-0331]